MSLSIDQEFVEVPTHIMVANTIAFGITKPSIYRVLVVTFDVNFLHHLELHPIVFRAELRNLPCRAWLLSTELIAREA